MRRQLRDIAEGRALGDVTTLRDPTVMEQLRSQVSHRQAHRCHWLISSVMTATEG
jgi:acetyl-CoA synthetase